MLLDSIAEENGTKTSIFQGYQIKSDYSISSCKASLSSSNCVIKITKNYFDLNSSFIFQLVFGSLYDDGEKVVPKSMLILRFFFNFKGGQLIVFVINYKKIIDCNII